MKKRRAVSILLMLTLLLSLSFSAIPVSAAKIGATVKGAVFPNYKNTVVLSFDDPDIKEKLEYPLKNLDIKMFIKYAIKQAAEKASTTTRYKIVIPPGTYYVPKSTNFSVPGNTWLYARGATINFRDCHRACIFTNHDGYRDSSQRVVKRSQNILIEGGTWDMSMFTPEDGYATTSPVRYCNMDNLAIKNVTLKIDRHYHLFEFADINGLTISNCSLTRNNKNPQVQPKEAIQIDVAEEDAFKNCIQNGKGCHNVIIEKCKIQNCARGIGSHNDLGGNIEDPSYTNVTIRNNTFTGLQAEAIHLMHGKNCTIAGNTINGAGRTGIYIEDCSYTFVTKNHIDNIKAFTGDRTIYGTFTAGVTHAQSSHNTIRNNMVGDKSVPECVYLYTTGGTGNNITGNDTMRTLTGSRLTVNTSALKAPALGKAVSQGVSAIKVTWGASSGAAGYIVYRKNSAGKYKAIAITGVNHRYYVDRNVVCGTVYTYSVRAFKYQGSNRIVSGLVKAGVKGKPVPAKPGSLTLSVSGSAFKLQWKKVSGASGYYVYRSADQGETFKKVKTLSGNANVTFTDSSVNQGREYWYKIQAYTKVNNTAVMGDFSPIVVSPS